MIVLRVYGSSHGDIRGGSAPRRWGLGAFLSEGHRRVPLLAQGDSGRQVQELMRLEEAEEELRMRKGAEPTRERWPRASISPCCLAPPLERSPR